MAQNFQLPLQVVLDGDGNPLPGAKLSFYNAGTTTPQTVYSDEALSAAVSQPLVADSAGRVPLTYVSTGTYKVVITDADDNSVATYDNLDSGIGSSGGALAVADGGTGATTAAGARSALGAASQTEVDGISTDLSAIETDIAALPGGALDNMAGEPDVGVDNLATGFGVVCLKAQEIANTTASITGTGSTFPMDDTIPQRTEGLEILSGTFTPEESGTTLEVTVETHIGGTNGADKMNTGIVALFEASDLDAKAAGWWYNGYFIGADTVRFVYRKTSAGAAITFSVRAGARTSDATRPWYVNGSGVTSGRIFGGILRSSIYVRELKTV